MQLTWIYVDSPFKGILEILEIIKKKKNNKSKPWSKNYISQDVDKFVDHDILFKLFNAEEACHAKTRIKFNQYIYICDLWTFKNYLKFLKGVFAKNERGYRPTRKIRAFDRY